MRTLEQIEQDLLAVQGNVGKIMDQLKVGDMVAAFQCGHSGMYFPSDYVKEYGRKYGVGLGPSVCSETLNTQYHVELPPITNKTRSLDQIMHPLEVTRAEVHLVTIPKKQYGAARLILHADDPDYIHRAPILRANQMKNPKSQLKIAAALWSQMKAQA